MKIHNTFKFKEFEILQDKCIMKVNTDGVLLGAWSDTIGKSYALDIGTGTGIIAMMLAQKNRNLHVKGIEIDFNTYQQAELNMQKSPFCERLTAIFSSVQEFSLIVDQLFDLIVSNPPFFTGGTFSNNENRANARHTVKLTHNDLLRAVVRHLSPDGHFDTILPYIEGLRFIELANQYQLFPHHITEVKSKPDKVIERLLIRFGSKKLVNIYKDELIIYKSETANDYTSDFSTLTKDFYLFL